MDFLNVATFGTSSSSTKVLVLDGNTVKSRTASQIVSDGGVASTVGRIFIGTASEGWSQTISDNANPGTPVPTDYYRVFVVGFKPTAFRLSFAQSASGASNLGIRAQFSTSSTDWSSVTNGDVVNAPLYSGSTYAIRTGTGSLSLSGSAPYYVRFLIYNTSGSEQTLVFRDLTLELWN